MITAPFILLIAGISGMLFVFVLKAVEVRRGAVFFASARKKCDNLILRGIIKLEKNVVAWRGWRPVVMLPYTRTFLQSAYGITNRLMLNKPMRLRGIVYSKGYYATERVSRYLREVSKGKDDARVSPPEVIED